jgi:hypothetical protein
MLGFRLDVRPSPPDHPLKRMAKMVHGTTLPLPEKTESWVSGWFPGVRNQGGEGSCTGHGGTGFLETLIGSATKHKLPYRLSPADLYARTRKLEGTFPEDSGCTVADVMWALHTQGVCMEDLVPYNQDPAEQGGAAADADAQKHRIGMPMQVALTQQAFKTVLAAGMPILVGGPVGRTLFSVGPDGNMEIPPADEQPDGGHCWFKLGYNPFRTMDANSWGDDWGQNGFFYPRWGAEARLWEAWTAPLVLAS